MEDTKARLFKALNESGILNEKNEEEFLSEGLKALEVNSMTFIKVIVCVEEEFNIMFDEYELNFELFESVEDLLKLIHKKMEES